MAEAVKNVLLFGCGYVASVLAERLRASRAQITVIKRKAGNLKGVSYIECDLAVQEPVLETAPDYVVYSISADEHTDEAYERAYVRSLKNAIGALERCGFGGRFIFTSSTGVYSQTNGEWIDEDSPADSDTFSGKRLLEAEALLANTKFHPIVVRFGGIYGPGRTRLIEEVRGGTVTLTNGSPQYTNRIHRDDCAAMLNFLLNAPEVSPLYLGVDDEPSDRNAVIRWIADQLKVPHPPFVEPGSRTGGKRCSNRLIREAGFEPRYPSYREGYRQLL